MCSLQHDLPMIVVDRTRFAQIPGPSYGAQRKAFVRSARAAGKPASRRAQSETQQRAAVVDLACTLHTLRPGLGEAPHEAGKGRPWNCMP